MTAQATLTPQSQNNETTRLIDFGLRSLEVSSSGVAERYSRGRTAHSGQVWWARRPHAAMRALVYSLLSKDCSVGSSDLLVALANEIDDVGALYQEAHDLLAHSDARPVVLDPFGGGGTIPHEAAALGADAISLDYNPLASFIQTVNLDWSQRAFRALGKQEALQLLSDTGLAVIASARNRTAVLYPAREASKTMPVFVYFWSYEHECEECGFAHFVTRRSWISKKKGRSLRIAFTDGDNNQTPFLTSSDPNNPTRRGSGRKVAFICPRCEHGEDATIATCRDAILATGSSSGRGSKVYAAVENEADYYPKESVIETLQATCLAELGKELPSTIMPRWSGIVNPSIYGLERHQDLFNPRQLAACLVVVCEVRRKMDELRSSHGDDVANYIGGALSGLIDQLVDWNSRLSMWIPQNEQVGRGFCGPGISMLWDYAEVDAFGAGPTNLTDKLKRIVAAAEFIPEFQADVIVGHSPAQLLPLEDDSVDIVVTDPPYYDNIFYNVLADNFYVWKRLIFSDVAPHLFAHGVTSSELELVASKNKQGTSKQAHEWYVQQLAEATAEMARVVKPDGVVAMVFGHSSLLGWEAIVRAFRSSGLLVSAMEPLSIERKQRPRAMSSEAVNTCIVIVSRPTNDPLPTLHLSTMQSIHIARARPLITDLLAAGWSEQDAGMAAFAVGVGLLAGSSGSPEITDLDALRSISTWVRSIVPDFTMGERGSI